MADEATIIELIEGGVPIRYSCSDSDGMAKGTVAKITDPRTATGTTSSAGECFAGVVSSEKVANDGSTYVDVYTKGFFTMTLGGNATAGDRLQLATGVNRVMMTNASATKSSCVGIALKSGSGGNTIPVFVGHGD